MIWNNDDLYFVQWYVQCQRNKDKQFVVYKFTYFLRDAINNCIWIKVPYETEWTLYNSLYFSNDIVGVYNPLDISFEDLLRIEFENSLDTLEIKQGLCFSFLFQFELGIENEEVIAGIKRMAKTNNKYEINKINKSKY